MRQKSFSLLLAGVITASSLFVISCSSDDEQATAPVQPETTGSLMQQFNDASNQLDQELSTLNLDEIALRLQRRQRGQGMLPQEIHQVPQGTAQPNHRPLRRLRVPFAHLCL